MSIKGIYRFRSIGSAQPATVLELMSDAYASPMRGRPVIVQGTVIGKADAGGKLGEDMTLQDPHGESDHVELRVRVRILGQRAGGSGIARLASSLANRVQAPTRMVPPPISVSQLIDLKTLRTFTTASRSILGQRSGAGSAVCFVLILAGIALIAAGSVLALPRASSDSPPRGNPRMIRAKHAAFCAA